MKVLLLFAYACCTVVLFVTGEDGVRRGTKTVRKWVVTGATGRTGALVYKLLQNDPSVSARAVVRNRTKAQTKLDCGACSEDEGVYVGDVTKMKSMEAAFKGVNGAFPFLHYAKGGSPKLVDYIGAINQIRLCIANGCDHVVLVSTMGTTEPDNFLDRAGHGHISFYKLSAEAFLMSTQVGFTIVKPGGLVDKPSVPKGLQVGHNDILPNGRSFMITRAQVADVVYRAIKMPEVSKNTRFDLCSDPKAPVETDYNSLFKKAARAWEDVPTSESDGVVSGGKTQILLENPEIMVN